MYLWENTPGLCEEVPQLTYYPAKNKKSDVAIIIFPGGAYAVRATHEGEGYAVYLNSIGYDAFVCDYRVAPHHFPLPLLDARRAVRTVRYYSEKYGIDKNKIAVMGSSAGSNLAAILSTYTKPIEFEGIDEIDKEDFMPNAQILCYPFITLADEELTHPGARANFVGEGNTALAYKISPEFNVIDSTPPAFIWHTSSDDGVNVIHSYIYAKALKEHNIPTEMHIFPFGGHGLGVAPNNPHVAQWTTLLKNWLELMF